MDNDSQIRRLRQMAGVEESIGILGDGAGVIFVAGKNGHVWVRDPHTQTTRDLPLASSVTFDNRAHGKPVRLGYVKGVLSVLGVHREALITSGGNVYIDNPTQAPVVPFIPQQRIMPLVVYPASVGGAPSFELIVRAWMWVDHDYQLRFFNGGRIDLSANIPSPNEHCWGVIALQSDMTLIATTSTPTPILDPLGMDGLQEALYLLPSDGIPIWAWSLSGDVAGLSDNDMNQDLRQFINTPSSDLTSVAWGDITGDLSTQTDLQDALNDKLDASDVQSEIDSNPTVARVVGTRLYAGEIMITTSGTFNIADYPDWEWVLIECQAGGGGGSGVHEPQGGGGGGAGARTYRWVHRSQFSPDEPVTIGAGGGRGDPAISGGVGGDGGNTSVGTLLSANAGTGGQATPAFGGGVGGVGGNNADWSENGQSGISGGRWIARLPAGIGGGTKYGSGGRAGRQFSTGENGLSGTGAGCAGGGADGGDGTTARLGGPGIGGLVRMWGFK